MHKICAPLNPNPDIEAELGADVEILPFDNSLQDIAEWSSNLAGSDQVLISSPSLYLGGASYAIYEVFFFFLKLFLNTYFIN